MSHASSSACLLARVSSSPEGLPCSPTSSPTVQLGTSISSLRGFGDVAQAELELTDAARARGWAVSRLQGSGEFRRLLIHGQGEDLLVDLAIESSPGMHPVASAAGPTFAPEELAGRKLIALFDRAAARDFVDVFALSRTFGKPALLSQAAMIDLGFNTQVLAGMFDHLDAYSDADIFLDPQITDIHVVRAFFAEWAAELRAG
jgi:hypothetical protein